MRRMLLFRLEAALARLGFALLRALGPVAASNMAGTAARTLGPWLPVSRVAEANLRLALPDLDAAARRRVVRGVWENLGRTVGELAHLDRLRQSDAGPGWEIAGDAPLRAIAASGGTAILVSGHLANWEILIPAGAQLGLRVGGFYRAAANPFVDRLAQDLRQRASGAAVPLFAKGAAGARAAFAHLRAGGVLGVLIDQKLNDGIAATLFGHAAMTSPAAASLALRFRCPLLPLHVERIGPARLRIVVEPPLPLPDSGDRAEDIRALTEAINRRLEDWVRARPDSWLWLHRRWPQETYR
ncbi:MAG: lauroyl acyltransferase [Rhodospirillales bacterium]|nr:lauroyl acyltransferase [Rhodospirillales bacterium]